MMWVWLWLARVPPQWRQLAFGLAAASVLGLSLTPVDHLPSQVLDLWDKAQHATGFLGLTLLAHWAWPKTRWPLWLGLLGFGLFIEWAQSATGWRHGDLWDWVADGVGVGLGACAFGVADRCCPSVFRATPPG